MKILDTNLMELVDVLIRALLSLIVLFFITKLLGKKQVSQMSLFDYVIGISIGNFAAEMTINLDSQEMNGILAVVIFGVVACLISFLTMKSMRVRRFFVGVPSIIIEKGKFNNKNLKKFKMDITDVLEQCRLQGYFDISQIDYAILEASGQLSVLPNSKYRPVQPNDTELKVGPDGLCANVIIDGKIMYNNLKMINKSEKWLHNELKKQKNNYLPNILLATVDNKMKLIVYQKNNKTIDTNFLE